MKNIISHKKRIALIFLSVYTVFIITNTIHFHSYSLLNNPSYHTPSKPNFISNHFIGDSYSPCAINHFSNSILDLKFSSDDLSSINNDVKNLDFPFSYKLAFNFFLSKNTPRAPPIFS